MKTGWIPTVAGAGASSLALEVALELGRRGRSATLVDADPVAELSQRTRTAPRAPLADVFGWGERDARNAPASDLAERVVVVPADGGRYVGAGVGLTPSVLAACAGAHATRGPVMIDLPPPGAPATSAALSVVDGVVGVVPATAAGLRSVAPFLRLLLGARTKPGAPPALVALAVTQVRGGEASEAIAEELRAMSEVARIVVVPWDAGIEAVGLRRELREGRHATSGPAISALADVVTMFEVVANGQASGVETAPRRPSGPLPRDTRDLARA